MFHVPEHPAEGLEKGVEGMCSQFQFIDVHLTKCLLSQKNIISKFSNPKVKYKYCQVEFENILKFSFFSAQHLWYVLNLVQSNGNF